MKLLFLRKNSMQDLTKYVTLFDDLDFKPVLKCPKDGPDESIDPEFEVQKGGEFYENCYKNYKKKLEEITDNPRSFFMFIDDINPSNLRFHQIYKDLDDMLSKFYYFIIKGYIAFDMDSVVYKQYFDDLEHRETFNSRFKLIFELILNQKLVELMGNNTVFRLSKIVEKFSDEERLKFLLRNSTHELLEKLEEIIKNRQKLVVLWVKDLKKRKRRKRKKLKVEKPAQIEKKMNRFEIKQEVMEAYDAVKTIIKKEPEVDWFPTNPPIVVKTEAN